MFALLCFLACIAISLLLHRAALMPLNLLAAIEIPIPVPHNAIPFLTFPFKKGPYKPPGKVYFDLTFRLFPLPPPTARHLHLGEGRLGGRLGEGYL